ncbi:MAG: hypothetical protein IJN43_07750, partial [Ruminococcus sp.]|nr:hypothetical protein [Ruminococcus sp.]
MARSTINALKAIEQRRKKEEEIRNTNSQTANTNKSSNQTTNTNKSSAVTSSGKETKTTLSTQNALNAIRKRREAESRANYSSTPSSKKYTDYNTETKNAYTSAKNKVNTKFTTKSNLSEDERKARIKEIDSEAKDLHIQLSGIGRAKAYGTSEALLKKEQEIKDRIAELSQEKKTLERTGTFSASELKQFEIDDAKARKAALPTYNPTARVAPSGVEAYKKNVAEHYALDKEIDRLEREKALYDDVAKFGTVANEDNFVGQWRANYRNNELSREADKAMSEYIMNPTEENKQIAYAYDAFAKEYAKNNEKALDEENVKASWLTKSMAGYLPQFKDQIVPELVGGGIGLLAGSAVGAPKVGMSVGAGLGTYSQTYDVMRGSVYRALLAEGVDEEVALKAAEDEALISSLIESGETALSWLLAGGGKAISAISGAAKASVAKGSTNAATKFVADLATKGLNKTATNAAKAVTQPLWKTGLRTVGGIVGNAATEYLEEFTQGAVSEANRERALSGTPVGGKGQLVKGAGKVISDAVTGKNPEVLAELHGQGLEGFKIGLMFGGSQTITNNIVSHYANAKTVKQQNDVVDTIINDEETLNTLIEEGKASGEGTVSEKIATEIETARANGKEVTREQIKKLIASNEVYIQSEEQTAEPDPLEQTAREVVNERNRTSTPLHETLEALSRNNEPITAEDAKKATGFGDKGAELVSNISNTDGATFYQTVAEVKPSYLAGFNNPDLDIKKVAHTFNSQAQEDAYTAGQMDGKIKALSAKENVKNVVVQKESGFVAENLPNDTQNAASPKNVRTKKSEWSAHDIEWNIPGKKNPIAFSTRATSDLIDMLATDNPAATISELKDIINYDEEAKKVMQQYINAGYGKQIANEWFSTDKERLHNNVIDKFEEESSQTSTRNFEIDNFIENVSEGVTKETKYKHLYNEETVSKEFLDSVNPEVESAILNIRNGNLKAVPDTIEVTKLSDGAIKAISDFVGFDVNGYVCKIEKDSLQHIERRHGVNGKHDQSMSDPKDLARMGHVINNIDNIEWVIDKKGNITLSKKYNNSDNSLCPVMQISARIDGTYCVSQVVPDTRRKTIWISSARIEKADGGNQVPNGNNVTPQRTSETPLDSSSAINNLSQKKDNVKTLKKEKALENNGDIDKFEDNKSISKLEEHENDASKTYDDTYQDGNSGKTMYDIPEGSKIVNNIVEDEYSKRLKEENPRAYNNITRMARRLGMNVRVVEGLTDENGKVLEGLITSKGVFINANAKNPSRFVATHEFGHRMKQASPKVWAKYQEYVINKLKRESFDGERSTYDVLYEETKNAYRKDDADNIDEEIAVNYAGELFDSEEMLESFIREDKSLALRVRDWWYNVLESMGLLSEKKKAQQMWLRAYTAAAKNVKDGKVGEYNEKRASQMRNAEGEMQSEETDEQRRKKGFQKNSLIKKIQNNLEHLSKEEVILSLNTDIFNDRNMNIVEQVGAFFDSLGNKVYRADFGEVILNKDGIKSAIGHKMGRAKCIAFRAVPDIIKYGKQIDYQEKWKGRPYDSYVFAGKVKIGNEDAFVGVVVTRNKNTSEYYLHEIVDNEGNFISIKNDEVIPNKTVSKTDNSLHGGINSSVDTTISQDNPSVNTNSMQNTAENTQEGKKSIAGTRLSELVEKYGAIPQGENPHREVKVPRKTEKNKKVSQTVRTILEAKATPDEAVPTIEKMVEDGIFSYDVYTDKKAINDAEIHLKDYGWAGSFKDWFTDVEKGVVSKQHTAMGWALYNNAANIAVTSTSESEKKTAIQTSLEILDAMVRHQRSAAQALQATRILKKLSPETQLYGIQKSVETLQNELSEKYGDKAPDLKIDEELAEKFINAKTPEERAEIEKEIYK